MFEHSIPPGTALGIGAVETIFFKKWFPKPEGAIFSRQRLSER
jgi:hypothetical protein